MKCHVCGGSLESTIADLPFRLSSTTIVVIKRLPVLECTNCTEFSLEDAVVKRVDELLSSADEAAELEVIGYAA